LGGGGGGIVAGIVWDLDLQVFLGLATGRWSSPDPPVSSSNKTDCYDITEILLKVALNNIKQTIKGSCTSFWCHL